MAAEYTAVAPQTVAVGERIIWTNTAVSPCSCYILHNDGSGNITVKGKGRYRITFGANASVGTAESVVNLALAVDGEPIGSSVMIATSTIANDLNNLGADVFVFVPCGCCRTISVINNGTLAATVQNANVIVEKVG